MNISIFALASLTFWARPWPLVVILTFLFESKYCTTRLLRLPAPSETSKNNSNSCLSSEYKESGRLRYIVHRLRLLFANVRSEMA